MSKHYKFILSPIKLILEDSMRSCSQIEPGIETSPLSEYILQTTLLKMTGYNEQKLKCILWELATDDYNFRYDFLKEKFGECSSFKEKNLVYKKLLQQIKTFNQDFSPTSVKDNILNELKSYFKSKFKNSIFEKWLPRDYKYFINLLSTFTTKQILLDDSFLATNKESSLKIAFDKMFNHRNRCAHNLISYQDNLPSFINLNDENFKFNNWFLFFFIIALIDNVFVKLFEKYLYYKNENTI